jgi:serine/threonine protein kinase
VDGFGPYHAIVTEYVPVARHGLQDYAHTDRDYLVPLAELATPLTRNADLDVVVGQCATFALSLMDAVRALHAQGVAHGTLRPSQVVAHTVELRRPGDKGTVKLVEGVVLTGMGGISLDPTRYASYMAPETMSRSAWGGKLEPTVEADVYGVGALVYRVLTRSDPEWGKGAGNSESDTRARIRSLMRPRRQSFEIPRPDGLGKSGLRFWEYLADLVKRCTLRDPRRRAKAVSLDAECEHLRSLMGLRMPPATGKEPENEADYQRISVLSLEPLRDGLGATGSFALGRPVDGQGDVTSG